MGAPVEAEQAALRERQSAVIADLHLPGSPGASSDPAFEGRLAALVHAATEATGMPCGTVNLLDGERQCQLGAEGFAGGDSPREESLCAAVTGWVPDVYAFADLATEVGFAGNAWVDGRRARVRAYASAPLVVAGTTIGTLCVFDERPRALSLAQCDDLAALAAAVGDLLGERSPGA